MYHLKGRLDTHETGSKPINSRRVVLAHEHGVRDPIVAARSHCATQLGGGFPEDLGGVAAVARDSVGVDLAIV